MSKHQHGQEGLEHAWSCGVTCSMIYTELHPEQQDRAPGSSSCQISNAAPTSNPLLLAPSHSGAPSCHCMAGLMGLACRLHVGVRARLACGTGVRHHTARHAPEQPQQVQRQHERSRRLCLSTLSCHTNAAGVSACPRSHAHTCVPREPQPHLRSPPTQLRPFPAISRQPELVQPATDQLAWCFRH